MGNTCHCVEEKDPQKEQNLANEMKAMSKNAHGNHHNGDDESNVGDDGVEQMFNADDPEVNEAATKIQVCIPPYR